MVCYSYISRKIKIAKDTLRYNYTINTKLDTSSALESVKYFV
ncbi:hypothetical protein DAI16_11720 [Enterococcus faecalis]|nr:hypothetical protein DAI16_11720 [Enterococcus faecalis]